LESGLRASLISPLSRRPWWRRAGQRVLRGFRPLAAPFLTRFQLRLDTAINHAGSIRSIEQRLGNIDALGQQVATADAGTQSRLSLLATNIESANQRIASVESQIVALRQLDEKIVIQLERLQLGMDAARLDQKAASDLAQETLRVHEALLQRANLELEATAAVRDVIGVILQRTDALLGHAAIPLGHDVMIRSDYGYLLTPVEDDRLLRAMLESHGRLEPGTASVTAALLQPGDWCVDVGAHIGTTVIPCAHRVGPAGRVIAVEPASRVGELLRRNLAINDIADRVTLYTCALGEQKGIGVLNLSAASGHSSLIELAGANRTETVQIETLDDLVPPGQPVRLVKIDVEGVELSVRRGMNRVVAENPALAVIVEFGPSHLRRAGVSVKGWLEEMLSPDFAAYEINEGNVCLRPLRGINELAALFSINLLLLRQPPGAYPELMFA
jgi:FkbM family methyltransferase